MNGSCSGLQFFVMITLGLLQFFVVVALGLLQFSVRLLSGCYNFLCGCSRAAAISVVAALGLLQFSFWARFFVMGPELL